MLDEEDCVEANEWKQVVRKAKKTQHINNVFNQGLFCALMRLKIWKNSRTISPLF